LGSEVTLGVVVVGAGFIAEHHIAALHASDRARLVGVVDTDPARAATAGFANGGVPATTDLAEALRWADAFIVCTPNGTHAAIAQTIADSGKHLLIEKPLATSISDAGAVVEAFRRSGTTLTVAHTHRAYDYSLSVKSILDSGAVGEPVLIRAAILGGWIWGDWSAWVLDPARSGGHLMHNGVHVLDLVSWWLGARPDSVYAKGRGQTDRALRIDDYLELVLTFPGGQVAQCEMSRAHRPGGLAHRDVLVIGTAGTVSLPWDGEPSLVVDERGTSAVPPVSGSAFARQLDGWLDAIEGGRALADGDDGLFAVAMAEAAAESITTGLPVQVGAL
jgi:predicted dehydrogenase